MNIKKKIALGACAVALTSMMAAPAFAADAAAGVYNPAKAHTNEASGVSPLGADMDINAAVSNSTNILSVTVPTAIPVGITTDTTTKAFVSFTAPDDMAIQNYSYDAKDGTPFKISTKIATTSDTMSLLSDVNMYVGMGDKISVGTKTKLDIATKDAPVAFVDVDAGTGSKATTIVAGTTPINMFVEDAKAGAALDIVDKIVAPATSVSAPVQTMVYISKFVAAP